MKNKFMKGLMTFLTVAYVGLSSLESRAQMQPTSNNSSTSTQTVPESLEERMDLQAWGGDYEISLKDFKRIEKQLNVNESVTKKRFDYSGKNVNIDNIYIEVDGNTRQEHFIGYTFIAQPANTSDFFTVSQGVDLKYYGDGNLSEAIGFPINEEQTHTLDGKLINQADARKFAAKLDEQYDCITYLAAQEGIYKGKKGHLVVFDVCGPEEDILPGELTKSKIIVDFREKQVEKTQEAPESEKGPSAVTLSVAGYGMPFDKDGKTNIAPGLDLYMNFANSRWSIGAGYMHFTDEFGDFTSTRRQDKDQADYEVGAVKKITQEDSTWTSVTTLPNLSVNYTFGKNKGFTLGARVHTGKIDQTTSTSTYGKNYFIESGLETHPDQEREQIGATVTDQTSGDQDFTVVRGDITGAVRFKDNGRVWGFGSIGQDFYGDKNTTYTLGLKVDLGKK